jgi:hypothetical protein
VHRGIDAALAHHHFDGVARYQVNQRKRQDGDADEGRDHHPTRRNTNVNMMRLVFSCGKCATGDGSFWLPAAG